MKSISKYQKEATQLRKQIVNLCDQIVKLELQKHVYEFEIDGKSFKYQLNNNLCVGQRIHIPSVGEFKDDKLINMQIKDRLFEITNIIHKLELKELN